MNMNVVRRVGLSLLLAPSLLLADSITLKSGEKIEGRITSETPQEVTIEVKVSATISDSRTVTRAEIASVLKPTAEDLAWLDLQALKPGESSRAVEAYEGPVSNLQSFVTRFPQSAHAAEANAALTAFTEEKRRVQGGEVKIAGKWLTREEATRERYQISGQLLYAQMQELARRGDPVGALNTFDNLEKNYPGARVFPEAAEFAQKVMVALKATADRTLGNWKQRKIERAQGLALASEPAKSELKAAQEREEKNADATADAVQKGGLKWPLLQAVGEKSPTYLSSHAQSESKRLEALPLAKMRQSLQQSDAGLSQLGKDNAAALEAFRGALTLWPANEVAARHQKELAEKATKATPAPATPAATPVVAVAATPLPKATPRPAAIATTPAPETPPENEKGSKLPLLGVVAVVVLGLVYAALKYLKKESSAEPDEIEVDPPADE